MTIHHDRQTITRVHRIEVTADTEDEIDKMDYNRRRRGYQRKLLIKSDVDPPWSAVFVRTEVVADTARGDRVWLDGRWEVKE